MFKPLSLAACLLPLMFSAVHAEGAKMKPRAERSLAEEKAHQQKRMDRLNKMTPEEWDAKQKKRAERKAKWDSMSPAEKDAAKSKMKEHHEKIKNMTPEERDALRKAHKAGGAPEASAIPAAPAEQ